MNGFIRRSEELPIDEIWLVDIPEGKEHLSVIQDLSRRMWEAAGIETKVHATLDRKEALADADFVITQFRVGRLYARIKDERIPLLHGMLGQFHCHKYGHSDDRRSGKFRKMRIKTLLFKSKNRIEKSSCVSKKPDIKTAFLNLY